MRDFQERVQQAVGQTYRLEKELGGGGMSRVFLAEEVRLGRKVVIKVLPPEMSAGVNAERFEREILLAARLQHPHVVPLLTAGSADDLLYYVMPFIKGESLRARLAREGELSVSQTVRILREVADALAYAHREGVVHRDIKPDNVLLADGHAVVTDFGVAKAVASSSGDSSLTSLGVALGTPAYMSPEQAAADPHVDHRADIYALGAMAYEMLTGSPPFTGPSPQMVLAAHVTQRPDPVTSRRPACPPVLAEVIMRSLAKRPADRYERVEDLLPAFDTILTPSGGMTPTGTQPVPAVDYVAKARKAHPARVAGLFVLAAIGVTAMIWAVVHAAGLPDWVFWGALGLLAAGLPIMLLTGYLERKRALARATGVHTMTPVGMKRLFTWRKALMGGGIAFAVLALAAGAFMAMRAFGIGPAATLVSAGKLPDQARILVADFENKTPDSTLAAPLSDAFRIDLSQSPTVHVLGDEEVSSVLQRMERPQGTRVSGTVAREIAEREGLPALILGEIASVGQGYVLSARVVGGKDGVELTAARETATDQAGILPALDRLSAHVREQIGESYRSLRNTQPLQDVTTSSLEALRLFSRGEHAEHEGDFNQAIGLYRQAVSVDTAFAAAWRKLAVTLDNLGAERSEMVAAASAAFRHRDRLPPVERNLAAAFYYSGVSPRPGADHRGLPGRARHRSGQPCRVEQPLVGLSDPASLRPGRIAGAPCAGRQRQQRLAAFQQSDGSAVPAGEKGGGGTDPPGALARKLPGNLMATGYEAELNYAEGRLDSATALGRLLVERGRGVANFERWGRAVQAAALIVRGRLREAGDDHRPAGAAGDRERFRCRSPRLVLLAGGLTATSGRTRSRSARDLEALLRAPSARQHSCRRTPLGQASSIWLGGGRVPQARACSPAGNGACRPTCGNTGQYLTRRAMWRWRNAARRGPPLFPAGWDISAATAARWI